MLKIIDLVYHSHEAIKRPGIVIQLHAASIGFAFHLKNRVSIEFVKHMNGEGIAKVNGIDYAFFKRKNKFWQIPFKTHQYIKKQNPDIIVVEGLIYPLQLIVLSWMVPRAKILVQHHGETPSGSIRQFFQKIADKYVSAYLFTSNGNASAWIKAGIINNNKCIEILEASTGITKKEKSESRKLTGMDNGFHFLWVGRLNANKDPICLLKGFDIFLQTHHNATLHIIYQENDLLDAVQSTIQNNKRLRTAVQLVGKIDPQEMVYWYSSADFYISTSHKEGSGYALLEAMACGCVPVVSDIPPFRKITNNGKVGHLFSPSDTDALSKSLISAMHAYSTERSENIIKHFKKELSFEAIADRFYAICSETISGKPNKVATEVHTDSIEETNTG